VDWKMRNLHFELVNEITPKYEAFPTSTLDFEHDFACENKIKTNQRMHKHRFHGLFQPLLILISPGSSISMDFIMDLLQSNSFDSILVAVDRFTKMAHFISCNKSITNEKIAKLFIDHVFRCHGLIQNIIFDHGL